MKRSRQVASDLVRCNNSIGVWKKTAKPDYVDAEIRRCKSRILDLNKEMADLIADHQIAQTRLAQLNTTRLKLEQELAICWAGEENVDKLKQLQQQIKEAKAEAAAAS